MDRKLILLAVVTVLVIAGYLFYRLWYMSPKQVAARCHKVWVETEGDYYVAQGNFYKCLERNGVQGEFGDEWFKWNK